MGDLGDGEPDTLSERAPESVVWCFTGAVDALSGPAGAFWPLLAAVEGVTGAGAWCEGVAAGSADSMAPVMDWKSPSLVEVMVKVCRQMTRARVA